jgi:hypothetical protein
VDSIPPAYVAWRAGCRRVVVPARHAGNRFLGSLKGLQIRALDFNTKKMQQGGQDEADYICRRHFSASDPPQTHPLF